MNAVPGTLRYAIDGDRRRPCTPGTVTEVLVAQSPASSFVASRTTHRRRQRRGHLHDVGLGKHYADVALMDDLRDSGLDWTAKRLPRLIDKPPTGTASASLAPMPPISCSAPATRDRRTLTPSRSRTNRIRKQNDVSDECRLHCCHTAGHSRQRLLGRRSRSPLQTDPPRHGQGRRAGIVAYLADRHLHNGGRRSGPLLGLLSVPDRDGG
jgi:hypothetical protein